MKVLGIDFTSTPRRRKPITCVSGRLDGGKLTVDAVESVETLDGFEALLGRPGPWIAGCDFPFGQARRLVENIGWPRDWAGYVEHVGTLSRAGFREALDAYRAPRPTGDREHRRATDIAAGAISPQKLHGVPVALMFHEGAPRLRRAGVTVPGLQSGDPGRIVVEAYPGVLARCLIGRRSYKNDVRSRQSSAQRDARQSLIDSLSGDAVRSTHGIGVTFADDEPSATSAAFVDDPMADRLDAVLCAVQAAWAWERRDERFGEPPDTDPLEGWIADPTLGRPPASAGPMRNPASPPRNGERDG